MSCTTHTHTHARTHAHSKRSLNVIAHNVISLIYNADIKSKNGTFS